MSKRVFQIISLIVSIISLIYLVASYYGYVRYIKLRTLPVEHYVNNYQKKTKTNKNRIVTSFKFNEGDSKKLKPFICSLLDQTVRIDDLSVIIPYSDISKIPEDIKKVLSIIGHKKDYGKCDNIVCSVMKEPEMNTYILLVEPKIYGEDFVQTLIDEAEKKPDNIIEASGAILIKPKFFDEKISTSKERDIKSLIKECSKSDIHTIEYSDNIDI